MAGGAPLPLAPLPEQAGRNISQARIRMRAAAGIDFRPESRRASCWQMGDSFKRLLSPRFAHSVGRPSRPGLRARDRRLTESRGYAKLPASTAREGLDAPCFEGHFSRPALRGPAAE